MNNKIKTVVPNEKLNRDMNKLAWLLKETSDTFNSLDLNSRQKGDLMSKYIMNLLQNTAETYPENRGMFDHTIGRNV